MPPGILVEVHVGLVQSGMWDHQFEPSSCEVRLSGYVPLDDCLAKLREVVTNSISLESKVK